MRPFFLILLTLIVQAGLFARVAAEVDSCPVAVATECHGAKRCKDACSGNLSNQHSHERCEHRQDCPEDDNCPFSGDPHHHHHGTCSHSVPMSFGGEGSCNISPPHAVTLLLELSESRAPDGPARKLDKPPLI